ncbi:hypothetical protein MPER_11336 [Moniliophthora perniciosa FA553]|nr:hypothetical protein MPER_11336 [Moniliophthora perniciosa FA553]
MFRIAGSTGIGVIRALLVAGDLVRLLSTADTTRIESTKGTPWEHKFSEADIANYIALLYQLIPYVKKLFQDLQATGKFIMRPLYYDFLLSDPFVANATRFNDPAVIHQFMSGQRLSIAPVGESGVTAKEVWMDEDFGSDGKFVNVSTPLDAISVFYLGSKDEILSGSV